MTRMSLPQQFIKNNREIQENGYNAHPWGSQEKPDPDLKMKHTVVTSSSYPIPEYWLIMTYNQTNSVVDLNKIFSNLAMFVQSDMQGSINGSRQEMEQLVRSRVNPFKENFSDLPPHTREIVDKSSGFLKLRSFSLQR